MSRLNMVLAISFAPCTITGVFSWAGIGVFDASHALTGFISIGAASVHGTRNRQRFVALARAPRLTP